MNLYRLDEEGIPKALNAITERLELRKALLGAMGLIPTEDLPPSAMSAAWEDIPKQLIAVQASSGMGLPLRKAFTSKIPYGLASTVPPKPVVETPFHDAIEVMKCLSEDSREAYVALKIEANESPSNLLVSSLIEEATQPDGWLIVANYVRALSGPLIRENQNP